MIMSSSPIEVSVIGVVGTVLINRPAQNNALSRAMLEDLLQVMEDLYLEKRVRAIVLTGKGDAFSIGMDARELQTDFGSPDAAQRWGEDASLYRDVVIKMMDTPKPIIASVNGPAVAGGAGLVLASDLVVAGRNAEFGLPDPRRGLIAGVVTPLLAFRIGAGQAARLALSSIVISADEAHRIGIYHELAEDYQLWARAVAIGEQCAAGAPEAVMLTKRLLSETVGEHLVTQLAAGAALSATAKTTDAAREGVSAYLEGRSPVWK
jgi:enoyl-CoA hydratase/carnithine racemase